MVKLCISSHYYCYLSYNSFHMGSHTDSCQFAPSFNDSLVMKNSHCQQFMPNLCYIVYIDLFIMAFWFFWFTDNYQWPMPNPYHIIFDQNDGWVVGLPITMIIKSFFKDIPNGRLGWSWKGPKVIVAGSLQLDIQLFITVFFTVLTFYVWC